MRPGETPKAPNRFPRTAARREATPSAVRLVVVFANTRRMPEGDGRAAANWFRPVARAVVRNSGPRGVLSEWRQRDGGLGVAQEAAAPRAQASSQRSCRPA